VALLFHFRLRTFGESVVLSEGGAWWWCTFVVMYRIVHTLEAEPFSFATELHTHTVSMHGADEWWLCRSLTHGV